MGQADGGAGAPTFGQTPGTTTTRHTRRFMHYISNNMDAAGLVGNVMDEGWQYIPYRTLRASVTPRQLKALLMGKRAFKVKKMGFRLEHFNPLLEKVQATGGASEITSQFENRPFLMKLTDHDLILDPMLETQEADQDWNISNKDLIRALPTSQAEGSLPRVNFNLGPEFAESLAYTNETTDAWGSFTTWSGFDIQTSMTGEGTSHTWHNKGDGQRWYPTTKHAKWPTGAKLPTILKTDYDMGSVEYNTFTQINNNFSAKPPPVLVRINPVHGASGAIDIKGQCFVTYFSEIEWQDNNPGLLTLNEAPHVTTASLAWDRVVAPAYTLAPVRHDSSWQEAWQYQDQVLGSQSGGPVSSSNHNKHHPYEKRVKPATITE